MVAAREFGAGDLIMLERPAILQPLFIQGFGQPELEGLLDKMLARLPAHVRNGYMTLSNCHPDGSAALGILRTNCIQVGFPDNHVIGYRAVAVDLSRCNHRCATVIARSLIPLAEPTVPKLFAECNPQIQCCQVCCRASSHVPHQGKRTGHHFVHQPVTECSLEV